MSYQHLGRRPIIFALALCALLWQAPVLAQSQESAHPLAGIPLRNIGPAITSGRISDFAFHPERKHEFFAATASGNLWKTTNAGITWTAQFEHEGSYSIGVVELDPNNPQIVWVGTGENNSQRSVAFGDGIYRSADGGRTWKNMGLKDSGHISQIWIHPDNSDVLLVAAQGPLWSDGGDRGLYRTDDGGETWRAILTVDEYTGVNEFVVDPRNFDNIVASTYQRRRHVWVLINGGPGSKLHKSTDGGESWTALKSGLPSKDHMGRIGLAAAPSAPDTLYAIIEGSDEERGVYRSTDFGENWKKQSGHMTTSPQYYNELFVDPLNPDRVYSVDTFTHVSEDAGTTWKRLSTENRHVDDHALWIDPDNTDHLYIGGDGGIYETWDRGQTWRHVRNLPITQFYRIQPDQAEPFYNVCGGTQDNNSLCAPSRTTVVHGITNTDWTLVLGGDGYKPQIDPTDPNIIYPQYQYGGLARYDRRTQERVYIAPHPESGENEYKWNWNTPLLISPHSPTRLFYASEFLFQSDDRGDSWRKISGDLTRQLDRNTLEVMGRTWSVDAVAKNDSTSRYGSAIALSESPLQEGLIFVGTDDGVISVTRDGGETWSRSTRFDRVPDMSLVEDIITSNHDSNVAYAVFDNHKRGDFKPYVLKTTNGGQSWSSITGNLPARGPAHTIAEDHVDPNLLFVGTEFGLFFTQDGGDSWHELTALPTIAVRDIEIQRRESDLVIGTFGRGILILDDYSPLRSSAASLAGAEATLFEVKDPWLYIQGDLWDSRAKGSMGAAFFTAPNPEYGALIAYYLSEDLQTQREARRKAEVKAAADGEDTPYPSWETLTAEDREEAPSVVLTIRDQAGEVVRRLTGPTKKGLHRVAWDMRLPPPDAVDLSAPGERPYWQSPPMGPLALPGSYSVTLSKRQEGKLVPLSEAQPFVLKALNLSDEAASDRAALQAFQIKTADLQRAVIGAVRVASEMRSRIDHLKVAVRLANSADEAMAQRLRGLGSRLSDLQVMLNGNRTVTSRNESAPRAIASRVASIVGGHWESQSAVTPMHAQSYEVAASEFEQVLARLTDLSIELAGLEADAEAVGAPWTPGRVPMWKRN